MRNILKGIGFGLLVGVILGWLLSEKYEHDRFVNDPDIKASILRREAINTMERLINEG